MRHWVHLTLDNKLRNPNRNDMKLAKKVLENLPPIPTKERLSLVFDVTNKDGKGHSVTKVADDIIKKLKLDTVSSKKINFKLYTPTRRGAKSSVVTTWEIIFDSSQDVDKLYAKAKSKKLNDKWNTVIRIFPKK